MTNTAALGILINYPVTFEPVRNAKTGKAYAFRVVTPDWAVQINERSFDSDREWYKSTRVYGALAAFVPGFNAEEGRLHAAIVNYDVKDPALARFHRVSTRAASARLAEVLPELVRVLRAYGFGVDGDVSGGLTAKFSRKAGCSMCPCSPGHVVSTRLVVNGVPVDMWFDEALPPVEVVSV